MKRNPGELATVNRILAAACRLEAPLPAALEQAATAAANPALKRALAEAARQAGEGRDLATALAPHRRLFPVSFLEVIAAGQQNGRLAETLESLAREIRFRERMRRHAVSLACQPLLALFLILLLMAFAGATLLPGLHQAFFGPGSYLPRVQLYRPGPQPSMADLGLALGNLFIWLPPALLALVFLGLVGWRWVRREAGRRRQAGGILLRLPLAGTFFRAVGLARFCRILAQALASRLPVPEALRLAGRAAGNEAIAAAAGEGATAVEQGAGLDEALADKAMIFPYSLRWMLGIGQRRGDIIPVAEHFASLQEEMAERLGEELPWVLAVILVLLAGLLLVLATLGIIGSVYFNFFWLLSY